MEKFFLNTGFSWTMSKIAPFVLMLILGIVACLLIRRFSKIKWVRLVSLVLILLPAFAYMTFNPIYQGDFSDDYQLVEHDPMNLDLEFNRLTVLAIPYCPYCEDAIEVVKKIRSRVGEDVEIDIIVCTTTLKDLDFYTSKVGKGVNVKIVKNREAMVELAQSEFPAFVYAKKDSGVRVWSNNQFGPRAKDWIEEQLN